MLPAPVEIGARTIEHRAYLATFPKAGTHLAELFIRPVVAPIEELSWVGTFDGRAWTTKWMPFEYFTKRVGAIPPGGYAKGHAGYRREFAKALWDNSVTTLFVYRNLRDVVISQAHHIQSREQAKDGDKLKHPGKALYQDMTFEEVVLACINGLDEYAGIAERWRLYAPWLDEQWVLSVSYEEMVNEPRETASLIVRYILGQSASFGGLRVTIPHEQHAALVDTALDLIDQHTTVTYRRGVAGGWRDEWSPQMERAWKRSGAWRENRELGYE